MLVDSSQGKRIPITLISDSLALVLFPLFIWNVLVYLFGRYLLPWYLHVVLTPAVQILNLLSRKTLLNLLALMLVNILSLLLLVGLNPNFETGTFVSVVVALIAILSSSMVFLMLVRFCKSPHRTDFLLKFSRLKDDRVSYPPIPFPAGVLIQKLSVNTLYSCLLVSAVVLYHILLVLMFPSSPVLLVITLHLLVGLYFSVDFEMIEHLAAHSRQGKLLHQQQRGLTGSLVVFAEWLRTHLVWSLFFWFPGAYWYTHTQHHHMENNGPSDWQSMLRYDRTSFLDFMKSIIWFSINRLIPLDTLRYLKALGRIPAYRGLLFCCLKGYLVVAVMTYLSPVLGLTLVALAVGSGFYTYIFAFVWHGFHDSGKPHDIEAGNNNYEHYAHHRRPGLHLFSSELAEFFHSEYALNKEKFLLHKSADAFRFLEAHTMLIQACLWQKKFGPIRNILSLESAADNELEKYVESCGLLDRNEKMLRIDRRVSMTVGSRVESLLTRNLPPIQRRFVAQ